jgi:CIC family chloride channel protein
MANDGSNGTEEGSLLVVAALSLVVGCIAGTLGALFRLTLAQADRLRGVLIDRAHGLGFPGFVLVVALCAAAGAVAVWLVRRYSPSAAGSGIPHVEAVLNREIPPAAPRLIPVKFFGGALVIGAGFALGREGPTVQMGASFAYLTGRIFRRSWPDCRVLLAAGAGAGLATAFNAPAAGAVFVLEELVRRFEARIPIAALGASATAIAVARMLLGDAPDFHVEALMYPAAQARPLYFVLGAVAGAAAVVYSRALVTFIQVADRLDVLHRWRGALIGAAVGALAWWAPQLVGGGDPITQRTLTTNGTAATLAGIFLLRFFLGAISFAAGAPGGLFAPMLVLGTELGLIFGIASQVAFPSLGIQPHGFALVGMVAFMAGVVQAPLTAITLVVEMTANVTMLLSMLGAAFSSMLVAMMFRSAPIYDSLHERLRNATASLD